MKNHDHEKDAAQSLCISCGLCCDGTIFDRAPITTEDDDVSLKIAGITVVRLGDSRHFMLPCRHLRHRRCDIYHEWRPRICSQFRCKVLNQYMRGEISFEQGLEIIAKTLAHVAELKSQIQSTDGSPKASLTSIFEAWEKRQMTPDQSINLNFAAFKYRI